MQKTLYIDIPLKEELEKLDSALMTVDGKEILNPKPMYVDVTPGPVSLKEQIQRLLRYELSARADAQGFESFEEANDLEFPEDEEPLSGYEVYDMVDEVPIEDNVSLEGNTEVSGATEDNVSTETSGTATSEDSK